MHTFISRYINKISLIPNLTVLQCLEILKTSRAPKKKIQKHGTKPSFNQDFINLCQASCFSLSYISAEHQVWHRNRRFLHPAAGMYGFRCFTQGSRGSDNEFKDFISFITQLLTKKTKNKVKCIAVKGVPKRIKHRVYGEGNIETNRNFFHLGNKLLAKLFDLSILKLELRSEMSGSVFLTLI